MLLLSVTSILLHSVAGLSDPLQRLRAEFNPEDRWNEAWLDKVHEWVEPMTD